MANAELLFPDPIGVFACGVFEVTVDTATGFVVVHVNVTLQLPWPLEIVHEFGPPNTPVIAAVVAEPVFVYPDWPTLLKALTR